MANDREVPVSLGHLGEAIYFEDDKKWKFSRVPGFVHSLRQVGHSRTIVATASASPPPASQPRQLESSRKKQVLKIVGDDPTLVPIASLLPPLAHASELTDEFFSTYDPLVGDLFALGQATHLGSDRNLVGVAAVVDGPNRDVVRLVLLKSNDLGWTGGNGSYLTTRTMFKGDAIGYWIGNGSPIQQVCFSAKADQPGCWLAVRSPLTITILRPLVRPELVSPYSHNSSYLLKRDYPPSVLDANPFVVLPNSRVGESDFADVAFNPWHQQQLAIINVKGHWSIWNIKGQQKRRHTWCVEPGISGDTGFDSSEPTEIEDGWAKVLWIRDSRTIAVATRSSLNFYDTQLKSKVLATRQLDCLTKTDRILDINRPSHDSPDLLILNSSCIFWIRVDNDINFGGSSPQSGATILLQCVHYRNVGDPSMQLAVTSQGELLIILLYSRLTELRTCLAFSSPAISGLAQCVSDPCLILYRDVQDLPLMDSFTTKDPRSSFLCMKFVSYSVDPAMLSSSYSSSTAEYAIHQLFTLHANLNLTETFYIDYTSSKVSLGDFRVHKSRYAKHKSAAIITEDCFIVPDGLLSDDEVEDVNIRGPRISQPKDDPRTISIEWLASIIQTKYAAAVQQRSRKEYSGSIDSSLDILMDLDQVSVVPEGAAIGIKPLSEFIACPFAVGDVDEASALVEDFWKGISSSEGPQDEDAVNIATKSSRFEGKLLLIPLMSKSQVYSGNQRNTSLLQIYEKAIQNWITSLSPDIPSRVRLYLDERLRSIVTQVFLASLGIQRLSSIPSEGSAPDMDSASNRLILPERRKDTAAVPSKGKERSQATQLSHGLDTIPSSSQPSTRDAQTSSQTHPQKSAYSDVEAESESYNRLRTLTSLDVQRTLPKTARDVLSHWELGADPSKYNWEALQEALAQAEKGEENLDRRQSMKQRRRQEKQSQRQRDSVVEGTSQPQPPMVQSSQFEAPPIVQSSQIGPFITSRQLQRTPFGGSSQFSSSQVVSLSQRKKKRAGFN